MRARDRNLPCVYTRLGGMCIMYCTHVFCPTQIKQWRGCLLPRWFRWSTCTYSCAVWMRKESRELELSLWPFVSLFVLSNKGKRAKGRDGFMTGWQKNSSVIETNLNVALLWCFTGSVGVHLVGFNTQGISITQFCSASFVSLEFNTTRMGKIIKGYD